MVESMALGCHPLVPAAKWSDEPLEFAHRRKVIADDGRHVARDHAKNSIIV